MHSQTTNVVWMCLECGDLFVCVIVEYAQLEVVRAGDKPVFTRNKLDTSHWDFCNFKCLDDGACFVVVDIDRSVV